MKHVQALRSVGIFANRPGRRSPGVKTLPKSTLGDYGRKWPLPEEIRSRYLKGGFQFYPIGGAGELTSDFGEAVHIKTYMQRHLRLFFI